MIKYLIILLSIFGVYFYTGGRSLNSDGDSVEMITAGFCNGIPHSSGYPLFVRLANLFIRIFGNSLLSVPQSVYFLNNCLSILTLAVIALILDCIIGSSENQKTAKFFSTLLALLYFAFSRTYWQESVTAEVYILHLLINSLIIYLLLSRKLDFSSYRFAVVTGILSGLGLTNHITIVFFLPVIWMILIWKAGWKKIAVYIALACTVAIIIWSDMYLRSKNGPQLNLGLPDNISRLADVLLMRQYSGVITAGLYTSAKIEFLKNNFFTNEFDPAFAIVAIIGFFAFANSDKKKFFLVVTYCATYLIAVFFFYRQLTYSAVYDTIYVFYLPAYLSFIVFFGYGMYRIFGWLGNLRFRKTINCIIVLIFIMLLSGNAINNFSYINNRDIFIFENLICDIMDEINQTSAYKNKILFTDIDDIIYLGWYYQIVEKKYRNVLIAHTELLKTSWFRNKNGILQSNTGDFIKSNAENIFIIKTENEGFDTIGFENIGLTAKLPENKAEIISADYRIADYIYKYRAIKRRSVQAVLRHYSAAYALKGVSAARKKNFYIAADLLYKSLLCDENNNNAIINLKTLEKDIRKFEKYSEKSR